MMSGFQSFKKTSLICFLLFLQLNVQAKAIKPNCFKGLSLVEDCDLCGCSTGGGSFGFGTLSNSNFIGLRYINQSFEVRDGIFEDSPINKETFDTVQLWAQIPNYKNFFVSANIPYQNLNRNSIDGTENLKGIGDASIISWYKLMIMKKSKQTTEFYNNQKEASGHSLQFGLGLKLPTGEFEQELVGSVNPGFQVGTGSLDGIFSLGYNYGGNKFGINTLFTYYLKGENKNQYQFGDQLSYATNFYFPLVKKEKMSLMPFLGISGDIYKPIKQYGEVLRGTDGKILNSSFGSELAFKKIIFGANYTIPLSQNLFENDVKAKHLLLLYLNFAFK